MDPSNFNALLVKQAQQAGVDLSAVSGPVAVLLKNVSRSYGTNDEYQKHMQQEVAHRTEQLIASTAKAYSFLDSINRGFIMCDTSGEVVLTNGALKNILTFKLQEARPPIHEPDIGTLDGLFQPDLNLRALIHQCLSDGQVFEQDNVGFGKGILHIFIAPLKDNAGTESGSVNTSGVVMLIEDVTEQKLLDRSKDEFLSIAAHELRTPLTAIRGNASLIQKYYGDKLPDQSMSDMLDDIHESCIRLIGIVNDFLDVSAIEQNKIKMQPENFNLGVLVTEIFRELDELAKTKGLELIKDPGVDNAPEVYADRRRIKQVIINLVGNAVKFTEHGSVTLLTSSDDHSVYVDVSDTGKGMDIENQKLLFRKFQQASDSLLTRDATQGTGLGLYISKHFIELSGGSIGVRSSEPGVGSTFRFSLPLAR